MVVVGGGGGGGGSDILYYPAYIYIFEFHLFNNAQELYIRIHIQLYTIEKIISNIFKGYY